WRIARERPRRRRDGRTPHLRRRAHQGRRRARPVVAIPPPMKNQKGPAMRMITALLAALALAGCATTAGGDPRHPWASLNRKTFRFNDALDKAVMRPIAQGYSSFVPGFAQEGVNNFFSNIEDVATSLNNFLQGKPKQGMSDAMRFVMNTTLGVFGLWD